jgi:hypothetical protein
VGTIGKVREKIMKREGLKRWREVYKEVASTEKVNEAILKER